MTLNGDTGYNRLAGGFRCSNLDTSVLGASLALPQLALASNQHNIETHRPWFSSCANSWYDQVQRIALAQALPFWIRGLRLEPRADSAAATSLPDLMNHVHQSHQIFFCAFCNGKRLSNHIDFTDFECRPTRTRQATTLLFIWTKLALYQRRWLCTTFATK